MRNSLRAILTFLGYKASGPARRRRLVAGHSPASLERALPRDATRHAPALHDPPRRPRRTERTGLASIHQPLQRRRHRRPGRPCPADGEGEGLLRARALLPSTYDRHRTARCSTPRAEQPGILPCPSAGRSSPGDAPAWRPSTDTHASCVRHHRPRSSASVRSGGGIELGERAPESRRFDCATM